MATVHLQEIAQVIRGVSFDKEEALDEGRDGYLPILRAGNIHTDLMIDDDLVWVPDRRVAEEQRMRSGDIAICMSSGSQSVVGKTATLRRDWPGSVGAFCAVIRPDPDRVLPDWLAFFLRSEFFRTWTRQSTGANIKNIRKAELEEFPVPVPPMAEQRRVVDLLSRAEGIVRLRRQAQQKAAALIPAIFVDMFGDPATNPKGWAVHSLSDVADVISGVAKGRQLSAEESIELPYMRVANVKDGHLDMAEVKTIRIKKSEVEKLRIVPGDLLMTEGGDPDKLGRAALWRGEIDLCVHQNHIFKVRSHQGRLVPEYLRSLAGSAHGKAYFLSVAKKTTGIASINKTQLSAFPVLLPPLVEQCRFQRQVEAVEAIAALQAAAAVKAEATFNALLARAFTAAAPEVQHEAERALA